MKTLTFNMVPPFIFTIPSTRGNLIYSFMDNLWIQYPFEQISFRDSMFPLIDILLREDVVDSDYYNTTVYYVDSLKDYEKLLFYSAI